ncbi:MAG: PPOX class F420-dependent oxidoreductase [Ilumatobacter sp.]|nr:PPOX class F420-dependent oxidoreductase [Ilumatobacter sp.]
MKKLPRDDRRARHMSSNIEVDLAGLVEFVTGKHHWVLATTRADGRPQMTLVTGAITGSGELLISSYPSRAKVRNAKRNPLVSVVVMGAEFNDAWVQIDGEATVDDMPEAADGLVEYYRSISGEHPDWDEYRQAMFDQGKSVIRIAPTRWSPVSTGGFPPELFEA